MKVRAFLPGLPYVNLSSVRLANFFLLSLLLASLCGCGFTRAQTGQNGSPAPAQPATAPVSAASTQPAAFHHTVKRGESIPTVVREYISHTSYMTGAELESALREVNHKPNGNNLKPGEDLIIPGYESQPIIEHSVPVPKDFEVRAIYLTGTMAGSDHGIRIIRRWHELGGNAVVFDIKDSDGSVNVVFNHPLAPTARHHSITNLPKLIRFLHSQNMHAIARIALFRDEHIARTYPELAVQSKRALAAVAQNKVAQGKAAQASATEDTTAENQAAQSQVAQAGTIAQQNQSAQSPVAQNIEQNNDAQSKTALGKTAPQPWRE